MLVGAVMWCEVRLRAPLCVQMDFFLNLFFFFLLLLLCVQPGQKSRTANEQKSIFFALFRSLFLGLCCICADGHCIRISAYKSRAGVATELPELRLLEVGAVGKSKKKIISQSCSK